MASNTTLTIQSIVLAETSPVNIPTIVLTAANVVAFESDLGTYKTALDAIILGVIRHETIKFNDVQLDAALPSSNQARRELKLLIRYTGDTSGDKFTSEIPCPDLAALTMESGDANFVLLADSGVMATWVTAAEVIMRSPTDPTEAITINSAQVVGRNI